MSGLEIQDGAAASVKRTLHGQDKTKDAGPKSSKLPKHSSRDASRDMLYYTQKLSGTLGTEKPSRTTGTKHMQEDMQADSLPIHWGEEEGEQIAYASGEPHSSADLDAVQPTLADILRAVNNCTVSVNTLCLNASPATDH